MNIGFDATAMLGRMSKNRGIGNYAYSQFEKMMELDQENSYFCFNLFEELPENDFKKRFANFHEDYWYAGKNSGLLQKEMFSIIIGGLIRKFLEENEIDIFYITSPFDVQVFPYRREWFRGVRTVATVYDIIPYIFKERYLPQGAAYQEYMDHVEAIRWIDKYLVISGSVREDMVNYLNFPEEKIEVIYGASDEKIFMEIAVPEEDRKVLFRKFGINGRFLMCTGGDDERKNLACLIESYAKLSRELRDKYQLVIVCKLSGESEARYKKLAADLNIKDGLVLTNFVTTEELVQLYNLADAMVFPSQYEGFGLPVVEAWLCGTPVVTSNNSSLGEIGGDGAVLIDPFDTDSIALGITEILTDEKKRVQTLLAGRKRLDMFRWSTVASKTIKILNHMDISIKDDSDSTKGVKKIAFFTPLPPLKSGIADYSYDIIWEISSYVDIDVFIDEGYEIECDLPKNVHVFAYTEFETKADQFDEIVYQVGNSLFHKYMFPIIKKHAGIVVLHDYNLRGVADAMYFYVETPDFEKYRDLLEEELEEEEAREYLDMLLMDPFNPEIRTLEMNGFVTNYAKKIIVHSDYAKRKLLYKDMYKVIKKIPHYVKIGEWNEKEIRPEADTIFAAFGHVHETKRIIPILEAFSRVLLDGHRAKMLFVGKMAENLEEEYARKIEELNLGSHVILTGYTTMDEFKNYMDEADVCLNLRHPYNGETSGSFMRLLEKGKCTIVNDTGSFSEIWDEACIKLPPVDAQSQKTEIQHIYKAMLEGLNYEKRSHIGKNARKYAEEILDLRLIGGLYWRFIQKNEPNLITEEFLDRIFSEEIIRMNYTESDIAKLSVTIGVML